MSKTEERRRYTRVEFAREAVIKQYDKQYPVNVIDISLAGALVETPESYALNIEHEIELLIVLESDIHINMHLKLAHSSDSMLGFHCESIDVESMGHLRRLIELNMIDTGASERVLHELISACA